MKREFKRMLKRMGYRSDSDGIINRYIRVGSAWEEHLQNTRLFILQEVSGKKIDHLAIYGSGWLLDLPLEQLSERIQHINLYDVVHPPQIMHKLRRFQNVTAVEADLTGGALLTAYEAAKLFKKQGIIPEITSLCTNQFVPDIKPDYTISLNILSQIADIVTAYLSDNIPPIRKDIDIIARCLQQSHLNLLPAGKSCIITDICEEIYDAQGNLNATQDLIKCAFPESQRFQTWKWNFDPLGEYHPGMTTISKVCAISI